MAKADAIFQPSTVQVGDTVGTLFMLSTHMTGPGRRQWVCRCVECGMERPIRSDHLIRYVGQPCKCKRPNRTQGGLSKTREYRIWNNMIRRCYDANNDNFRYYGGIGRYVCQRWRDSFANFLTDLGRSPSIDHSLDRIDTSGNYTCGQCDECREKNQPFNCRWATKDVQARNASNNRYYTHNGKTLILKDWARLSGIEYLTLHNRLERGWSFEKAIETPKLTTWSRHPSTPLVSQDLAESLRRAESSK